MINDPLAALAARQGGMRPMYQPQSAPVFSYTNWQGAAQRQPMYGAQRTYRDMYSGGAAGDEPPYQPYLPGVQLRPPVINPKPQTQWPPSRPPIIDRFPNRDR